MKIKNRHAGGQISVFMFSGFNSGDDLLFRGLSQSTIGDTAFPCLVRNGTEGDIRSIITRIKSSEHHYNHPKSIVKNLSTFSSSIRLIKIKR